MPRHKMLEKMAASRLHPNLKRWFVAYFADRRMKVVYQAAVSKWKKSKLGMVQGGPDSPPLWNLFTSDFEVESADLDEGFADDFHTAAVSPDLDVISGTLNVAAGEMVAWAKENEMTISAPKSTVTVFTSWTKQVNAQLDVEIEGVAVPTEKNPRLLGVIFDPTWTFSKHAAEIARRSSKNMNILQALSDSDFGKDKECLLLTYKLFIRSIINYAAPIVYPNYSSTSIEKLQKVQNRALRLVLGCHSLSSIDHLHAEAKELLVKDHLRLLSSQFLAKALQPHHVSNLYVKLDKGRRDLRDTLRSKCINDVQPFLDENGDLPRGSYNEVKSQLHTNIVRDAINRSAPNRVLGRCPPEIHDSEKYLQRAHRVTLSQLRSGHCARLRDYQLRIGKIVSDLCPECNTVSDTVSHLFSCPSHPTNLTTEDLWKRPWDVVNHLSGLQAFAFLPDPGPPPPPARRRRRPPIPPDPPTPPASPDPPDRPDSPVHSPLFSPLTFPISFDFSPQAVPVNQQQPLPLVNQNLVIRPLMQPLLPTI